MKKILLASTVLATSFLLVGCQTREPIHGWYKKGVSQTKTENAELTCENNALRNKNPKVPRETLKVACMKAKGFKWQLINR